MRVRERFCAVDDCCQMFEPTWRRLCLTRGTTQRTRARSRGVREMMTILILFHRAQYRTFKACSTDHGCAHLRGEVPGLVRDTRCVAYIPDTLLPLCIYVHACLGTCTGISFVDATKLAVCHTRRMQHHQVFAGRAKRGNPSIGWVFGFKLQLVFHDGGALLTFTRTPGNIDDRAPVPQGAKQLFGTLFGDKGDLAQPLATQLASERGVAVITPRRKHMNKRERPRIDQRVLRKRAIVEPIINPLKHISQIAHTVTVLQ